MAQRIDRKQVTLTATNVKKVLEFMGLTNQATRYGESGEQQVVDIKGPAADVSRVLSRVEEFSRKSELVRKIGIDDPHQDLLAHLDRPQHKMAKLAPGKFKIDVVREVREGIEQLTKLSHPSATVSSHDDPVVVDREEKRDEAI